MNWRACSTSGGITAAMQPARTANTTTTTSVTAAHRGILRLTSDDTAGSSPSAKNNAAPTKASAVDADPSRRITPYVTATPAEAVSPRKNGDPQSNRSPREPNGRSAERIREIGRAHV